MFQLTNTNDQLTISISHEFLLLLLSFIVVCYRPGFSNVLLYFQHVFSLLRPVEINLDFQLVDFFAYHFENGMSCGK